ncbi:GtrA family protein [Patescibacteria group bacterium]|nr:GtrA family protein [Patescibacteria group bacterium]MBU4458342.1 GtrA family protein [Patescibacteria group bacterium]MCG2695903.1 GtrA family protein [Candidatus Portnoybacteria bacterium]
MKKNDIIAVLFLGEIVAWLILAVAKGILNPDLYDKIHGLITIILPIIFPIACLIFLYLASIISKKIKVAYEVAKFILVGGLNTLVDWGVLSFLIFAFKRSGINSDKVLFEVFSITIILFTLLKATSFIIATINSYIWNKLWTFKKKTTEKLGREFIQFITVSIIGFLINVGIASSIFKFIPAMGGLNIEQWAIIAAAIASAISMTWNFVGYKFIVFNKKDGGTSDLSQI